MIEIMIIMTIILVFFWIWGLLTSKKNKFKGIFLLHLLLNGSILFFLIEQRNNILLEKMAEGESFDNWIILFFYLLYFLIVIEVNHYKKYL